MFHLPTDTAADFTNDYVNNLVNLPGWRDTVGSQDWAEAMSATEFKPAARFLVFGANGWIGAQFVQVLIKQNIEVIPAKTRPGDDKDEVVAAEITEVAPSHVTSFLGRTHGPGCGNIDYLEGGADKLKENVQDNLFAPWMLANLCEKYNLHFIYLGTGCLFQYNEEHQRGGKGYTVRGGVSLSVVLSQLFRKLMTQHSLVTSILWSKVSPTKVWISSKIL